MFAVLILLRPATSPAAVPERQIAQYTHQRWSDDSTAPRPVFAMAQDLRGYLWIAASTGLFRFDGMRFEPISAGLDLVANGPPSAILVRRNGEVWTNFERSGRFAIYHQGRLRFLRAPRAPHRVAAMREAPDGTIWVLTERVGLPLMRFRAGRWSSFGTGAGAPLDNPYSMVVAHDGTVWVSFNDSVAKLAPNGRRFEFVRRDRGALGRLSLGPQGRIWLSERRGTYPLTGPDGQGVPPPLRHAYATDASEIRGWPGFDREGNLWIATYYNGLERIAHPDPRGAASGAEAASRVERFTARDGLSSNSTSATFQDAEGNIWVATENGLDRFWPATIRVEPELTHPAAFGDLLLQVSDGTIYIGEASTVYRVRPGGSPEPILRTKSEPRTMCEAPDGSLWISLHKDKHVLVWRNGLVRRSPERIPLAYTEYDCAFDAKGDYWVTASFGGMARLHAGRWERMFGSADGAFLPKSMLADTKGRLIVHWNDHKVAILGGPRRRELAIPFDGYAPDDVTLTLAASDTVYVAGRFGLGRIRAGRFETVSAQQAPALSGVNGMSQTSAGETWLASPTGILRLRTSQLDRAYAPGGSMPSIQVFDGSDGLRSRPHSHSRHAIVRGGDGRLWIAVQDGTMWLDPQQVMRNEVPPAVAVGALVADRVYRDPTRVELPAGTSDLHVDFAVLSFSDPHRVRVRYRIEGQDTGWVDAGDRRQAFYTNLSPGTYRFRLIAANESGVWNNRGAMVEFVIPPTFLQSWWFVALCAILIPLLLWLAYRVRMAQVGAGIRNRLEARLAERERIARELHDTLLQSVQGLILRFQSVANKMPPGEGPRLKLEAALERADEVISEGRNRVQELRAVKAGSDLPELLRERAADIEFEPSVPVRIVVEGRVRGLSPIVSDELVRIVEEALLNASRHADARSIDLTVRFGAHHLWVEVRDDGVGIASDVLQKGYKEGHFGLVGMRERAERVGGILSVESRPGVGSAVAVSIPARLAFPGSSHGHSRIGRFLSLWRRS